MKPEPAGFMLRLFDIFKHHTRFINQKHVRGLRNIKKNLNFRLKPHL